MEGLVWGWGNKVEGGGGGGWIPSWFLLSCQD